MDIAILRMYCSEDAVLITQHAAERCRQRGILSEDIIHAIQNGEIIEEYPDDFPFPSCLILGTTNAERSLHVCMSDEGSASRIITAYYPSSDKWEDGFRIRKER